MMESVSMIEPWKLLATVGTILIISLVSFLSNYWLRRRSCRSVSDHEEEEEIDTRTPEELFEDKLFNEEYGAALEIARIHNLDADLVYQQQWNKSDVTIESIDNFLSNVQDQQWILCECLERIPQDLTTNKYLLDFGIELTESMVDFDETDDFNELDNEQRQTVLCRKRLLQFRDRLLTFEHVIGGNQVNFSSTLYEKFRRQELFENCLQFAREGDHRAMATVFTFYGAQTIEHWLPLLSQIPEVVRPFEYRSLLPEAGLSQSEEDVYPWEEVKPRDEDWCEKMVLDLQEESSQLFYATHQHLIEYRSKQLTKSIVSNWFCVRSRQIEQCTSLISNALELVQLGIERNFPDLAGLHARFDTFATLIYDCLPRADDNDIDLTFERFSRLTSDEIVRLLMSGCKKDSKTFIKCLRQSLIPYLHKYDSRHAKGRCQGSLENFLVECAKESLHLVRAVFEQSFVDSNIDEEEKCLDRNPIVTNVKDLLNLASRCINECTNENFLSDAFAIIECLPQRSDSDPPDIKPLQDEIDTLENNLAVIELLEKNGCRVLMGELKSIQKNPKDVKRLFTEMMRKGSKRSGFKILDEEHWKQLLQEALQARSDCFPTTITESEINEIFIKTLLSYGREENFDLAYNLMKNMDTGELNQLILDCSRDYVNSAGSTGDTTIGLAKRCLHLLPKETLLSHPDVREELDLIAALEIIDEFWTLPLLPVQLRLMDQPRIQLIHHLLQHNKAYKQVSRVLQVAQLTRVCLDCEPVIRDGTVLIILGEAALDDQDFKSCWNVCELLMDREFPESWKLCLNLALNTNSLKLKINLLSFALSHCEEGNNTGKRMNQILELIEKTRISLEQEHSQYSRDSDANLINLDVLTAGAQLGEEVVVKTASHLTSWLLPKLKSIRNDAKIIIKPTSSEADDGRPKEIAHAGEISKSLINEVKSESIKEQKEVAQVELKQEEETGNRTGWEIDDDLVLDSIHFDTSVDEAHVLGSPSEVWASEEGAKEGWDIEADSELDETELAKVTPSIVFDGEKVEDLKGEVVKKEDRSNIEEASSNRETNDQIEGWDIDDDLELESFTESGTITYDVKDEPIETKQANKEQMVTGWDHDDELVLKPSPDLTSAIEDNKVKESELLTKVEGQSGWECDEDLLVDTMEEESGWQHDD